MAVIAAELPEHFPILHYTDADLPTDWNAPVPPSSTKDFGTNWAKSKQSVVISIPSAIVPDERNYLVNPAHPDFGLIRFSPPKPFIFDPRLK